MPIPAYFTELNLQICGYAQKRRICRENSKYALDENFHDHLCPQRKAAKFCHPAGLNSVVAPKLTNIRHGLTHKVSLLGDPIFLNGHLLLCWTFDSERGFSYYFLSQFEEKKIHLKLGRAGIFCDNSIRRNCRASIKARQTLASSRQQHFQHWYLGSGSGG